MALQDVALWTLLVTAYFPSGMLLPDRRLAERGRRQGYVRSSLGGMRLVHTERGRHVDRQGRRPLGRSPKASGLRAGLFQLREGLLRWGSRLGLLHSGRLCVGNRTGALAGPASPTFPTCITGPLPKSECSMQARLIVCAGRRIRLCCAAVHVRSDQRHVHPAPRHGAQHVL